MNLGPILNAFPKKTRVTFIHAITGKLIGIQKMKQEQLPLSFNKPVTIEWEGTKWRVMKAKPIHAKEFIIDNKLTLHVQEGHSVDPSDIGFNIPTICTDWPELGQEPLFTDFVLELSKDQWRQLEFLPATLLPAIQEEMLQVEAILFPGEGIDTLAGYKNMHIRKKTRQESLTISADEFCSRLNISEKGAIRFPGDGFIQNSFSFRTGNYTYYGTIKDGMIEELCLESIESVDEEFCEIASAYDLALADWCNGRIIMV